MKKIIIITLTVLTLLFLLKIDNIRQFAKQNLPPGIKIFVKEFVLGKQYIEMLEGYKKINYNSLRIPQTQFDEVSLKKIKIENLDSSDNLNYVQLKKLYGTKKKFFIENFNNDLIIISFRGEIFITKEFDFKNDTKEIESNLNEFDITDIKDIEKINNKIFISVAVNFNKNQNCGYFKILEGDFNEKKINFKNFFESDKCLVKIQGGRIKNFELNEKKGFLLTTAAVLKESKLAQDVKSIFGKIIFFDLKGNFEIFSKGHRNPQGLFVTKNNVILQTEHGPFGGDEINKIEHKKNYGWPISSYGENYDFKESILFKKKYFSLKKNHNENNFEEPIFSFVPSIGISEIIKVPNNFSRYWKNNYIVSSLNGRSIFRIKFDNEFTKISFLEKIYIGERIRDITIGPDNRTIFFALEDTGSVGEFKSKN
jgi:hypothetical protein